MIVCALYGNGYVQIDFLPVAESKIEYYICAYSMI
jgi:hypothetical protein